MLLEKLVNEKYFPINEKYFPVKEKFDLISRKVFSFYFGRKTLLKVYYLIYFTNISFSPNPICYIYIYIYIKERKINKQISYQNLKFL